MAQSKQTLSARHSCYRAEFPESGTECSGYPAGGGNPSKRKINTLEDTDGERLVFLHLIRTSEMIDQEEEDTEKDIFGNLGDIRRGCREEYLSPAVRIAGRNCKASYLGGRLFLPKCQPL